MPKSPEKNKNQFTAEEAALRIGIEREIMARSKIKNKNLWVEKNGKKFQEIFDPRKDEFLKMFKENPEALYGKIQKMIEEEAAPGLKSH